MLRYLVALGPDRVDLYADDRADPRSVPVREYLQTGTIDSLADIARKRSTCAAWNRTHGARAQLVCGQHPPDDRLFVIAFGVVTPRGTIPITLGLQLQRGGSGAASKAAPAFVRVIAEYLRGQ